MVPLAGPQQSHPLQPGRRHRTDRAEQRLPKYVLTAGEAEQIINQPNVTPRGIRDRAILETLYSTGIRRMELVSLRPYDIDTERGTVMIRQGKGKRIG